MFHVCSLLVMSESPLNLNCSKNASKLATRNQTRSAKNYSKDIGDALHSSPRTIQLAQKLEKNEKLIKTKRFPSRVLWREMKGIWEKYGEIWKVRKITTGKSQVEYYFGISQGEIILGVLRCPALLKNQSEQLPEPPNSPRSWKSVQNLSKPNASHREFFGRKWRECGINTGKYEKSGNM